MRRTNETRLDRLVEARREQDSQAVNQTVADFLGGLTPSELWECSQRPDVCRERLNDFLATQPDKIINTIERWSKNRRGAK